MPALPSCPVHTVGMHAPCACTWGAGQACRPVASGWVPFHARFPERGAAAIFSLLCHCVAKWERLLGSAVAWSPEASTCPSPLEGFQLEGLSATRRCFRLCWARKLAALKRGVCWSPWAHGVAAWLKLSAIPCFCVEFALHRLCRLPTALNKRGWHSLVCETAAGWTIGNKSLSAVYRAAVQRGSAAQLCT